MDLVRLSKSRKLYFKPLPQRPAPPNAGDSSGEPGFTIPWGLVGMLPPASPKNMLPTAPCPDHKPENTLPHALVIPISSKPEELKADGQAPQEGHRPCLLYTSDAADDWLVV